ncbi:16S rRNA (guanine(527)-N(7))-methyltransferase RsmG [Palleronia aestuarii]|uniref:16S rRNA (guanine(527)-N(7))-methyltransferase RsmG n=1 Tax=Palleronia aestuarii TaxID=568105 RepID=UPI000DAC3756
MLYVSRETREKLNRYVELLLKWNSTINLISKTDERVIWCRHIADCHRLCSYIPAEPYSICDMGSGGGLPGVVVALSRPDLHVNMIESDRRKAVFLSTVCQDVGISATVLNARIEDVAPIQADIVIARALAPLHRLFALGIQHAKPSSKYLFLKGKNADYEIEHARAEWDFSLIKHESKNGAGSMILELGNVRHA